MGGIFSRITSPIPDPYEHIIEYVAEDGSEVFINGPMNPWGLLHLERRASRDAVNMAFRVKFNQSTVPENRAMLSLANHMLTSTARNRYQQKPGTNEFFIKDCDVFVLAACGHTAAIASKTAN